MSDQQPKDEASKTSVDYYSDKLVTYFSDGLAHINRGDSITKLTFFSWSFRTGHQKRVATLDVEIALSTQSMMDTYLFMGEFINDMIANDSEAAQYFEQLKSARAADRA
ncbi:hypothetical protein J2X65_004269 [Ancylobacter sp. 3268]|uniref:hypothetical protein n=1 Tax=Ancylobacter sp. 3268 TaxID=2817752 RepID=UPI002860C887|nr:hypothetical protein [Ancylobacter sp. 3268]MDR6954893.1 hypothetical protein [Ancylobacter sp. 3268]